MHYLRSALTYGAVFCLTGLLFLFFGGLALSGRAEPPALGGGWTASQPAVGDAGLILLAVCFGLGLLVANWSQATWGETVAVLVISIGILWALSPWGLEEVSSRVADILWQVGWMWKSVFRGHLDPGWSARRLLATG